MVQPDRPHDDIIRRVCIACRITKATKTHSEHVGLNLTILPTQIWLSEGLLMLRCTYITCLVMQVTNGMIFGGGGGITGHEMCVSIFPTTFF